MDMKPGVWIASDSGGWWKMSGRQVGAWNMYKKNHEWKHRCMGSSIWQVRNDIEYSVNGYLFVVSDCGDTVWLRTSDGKMREVLAVEAPRTVWKREVVGIGSKKK